MIFSRIIEYLFNFHEVEVRYAFVGLMLGTLPSVVRQANRKGYKNKYLIPFFLTLFLTLVVTFMESSSVDIISKVHATPLHLIIYGSIIGFGTIIPGISASIILMYLGAYPEVIGAISNLELLKIIYLGIGFVLSVLLFAKMISALFQKAYSPTYYAILGLVLGSIISVFLGFYMNFEYLLNCIILIAGFMLAYSLSLYTNKR